VTIEVLRRSLSLFAQERQWEKFHTPRNLVLALVGEVSPAAGSRQQHFPWYCFNCARLGLYGRGLCTPNKASTHQDGPAISFSGTANDSCRYQHWCCQVKVAQNCTCALLHHVAALAFTHMVQHIVSAISSAAARLVSLRRSSSGGARWLLGCTASPRCACASAVLQV
jgi:hypothetical protein